MPRPTNTPLRIAYQGEPGAFSESAALKISLGCTLVPCPNFEDVFAAVEDGAAGYGVLPVENSVGGSIHRNYDLLLRHSLPIRAEVEVCVVHQLLALPGVALSDVRRVYSHPQALAQCEHYLSGLANVEKVAAYDTAGSAKLVADQNLRDAAAIASARAGELFGLVAIASSIQDFESNVTRFVAIGREPFDGATPDKVSVAFRLASEPGTLEKMLHVFSTRGLNITKLESRPVQGKTWEYWFYLDAEIAEPLDGPTLADLSSCSLEFRVLGSYQSWGKRGA